MRLTIAIVSFCLLHSVIASTNDCDVTQFGGVGLLLCAETNGVKIVRLAVDSTSEEAGLFPGDVITKVAGQDLAEMSLHEACALLRGPTGSMVEVSFVSAADQNPRIAQLRRHSIDTTTVKWREGTAIVYPDGSRKHIK